MSSLIDNITNSRPFSANSGIVSNYSSIQNGSIASYSSGTTLVHQSNSLTNGNNSHANGYDARSSSVSQFANESILDSEASSISKQRKTPAETVLGVIAGIGM